VDVPIVRRNTSLVPIQPVGIFFDRGPHFLRRKSQSGSQANHGARDVNADQDAPNIEDDSAELGDRHSLVAFWMRSGAGALAAGTERMPGTIDTYYRGKYGKHDDDGNDVMDARTNIRDRAA